jgi:hypothetical protein
MKDLLMNQAAHRTSRILLYLALLSLPLVLVAVVASPRRDPAAIRGTASQESGVQSPLTAAIRSLPIWEQQLVTVASSAWRIPSSVPSGGVRILVKANPSSTTSPPATELYLEPATQPSPISENQARTDALSIDNAAGLSISSATWANVTVPAEEVTAGNTPPPSAVLGRNSWVVVVSAPSPVMMQYGCDRPATPSGECASAAFSHDTLVIDASSGKLLYGYYS